MNKIKLLSLFSIIILLFGLPAQIVLADTGPKPTMEFEFEGLQDGELTIISGVLYECNQSDCSDATPLAELGPQGLYCEATSCRALGYGFAPYHILEIEFSDEVVRRSNIFETAGFDSTYTVTVQPNDLFIKPQLGLGIIHPYLLMMLTCVCLLGGIILVVGLIIFFVTGRSFIGRWFNELFVRSAKQN